MGVLGQEPPDTHAWKTPYGESGYCFRHSTQPVLGSIGFPFPWKNFDRLASLTCGPGRAPVLIAPGGTPTGGGPWKGGAILQGVAAPKPMIAFSGCRQFRALCLDPLGREAIRWCGDWE